MGRLRGFSKLRSCFFQVCRGVQQGSDLGRVIFTLFINDFLASLPSSVNCCVYADDLAIWSSSSVPAAVEATQEALTRLKRWSEYWRLPLNRSKCETSFFTVDLYQADLQLRVVLFSSPPLQSHSTAPPLFQSHSNVSWVTFDRAFSFAKHVSSLKAKFFPRLKTLRYISASLWGPSKESLSLVYKAFLQPLLTCASPR